MEDGEDPGRDDDGEEPGREEVVRSTARDHLRVSSAAEPRIVPRRPAHPEREDGHDDHLAVPERHAVEAAVGEAVIVLDEEAVEQVEGVERRAADDSGPCEREHLPGDVPVDAERQIAHVLPQRDHEGNADGGERGDQDALHAEVPYRDEQDAEDDLGDSAGQRVEREAPPPPPEARQVHRQVDDVRQVVVDERDHEVTREDRRTEDLLRERRREDDQRHDDDRRVDRLDQEVERDDLPPPHRLVAIEVEAREDAVHSCADHDVDERDGREDELEAPELRRRKKVRVQRDEQERERLEQRTNTAVERGVARERCDAVALLRVVRPRLRM